MLKKTYDRNNIQLHKETYGQKNIWPKKHRIALKNIRIHKKTYILYCIKNISITKKHISTIFGTAHFIT
jgi:hypothetical protein